MSDVKNFEDYVPSIVGETICLKCYHRWIAVIPERLLLKHVMCPECGEKGYVIATGQVILEDDYGDT